MFWDHFWMKSRWQMHVWYCSKLIIHADAFGSCIREGIDDHRFLSRPSTYASLTCRFMIGHDPRSTSDDTFNSCFDSWNEGSSTMCDDILSSITLLTICRPIEITHSCERVLYPPNLAYICRHVSAHEAPLHRVTYMLKYMKNKRHA
jgi:hypothetical protein